MYLCVFLCILIYFTFLYSENPATTPAMKPRTNSTYPTFYCRKTRQVYGLRTPTNSAADGDYIRCIAIDTLSDTLALIAGMLSDALKVALSLV